jgi:hypothetical protein
MPLTKTAAAVSTDLTNQNKQPDSITSVFVYDSANTNADFTAVVPRVLYTAPSSCSFAKIHFVKARDTGSSNGYASIMNYHSSYYYKLSVLDSAGTYAREIIRTNAGTYGDIQFNRLDDYSTNVDSGFPILRDNDVLIRSGASQQAMSFVLGGELLTLGPGEKLQVETSNAANNSYISMNFEAWVYN